MKRIRCSRDYSPDDNVEEGATVMTNGRTIAMAVCGLLLAASPNLGHTDDKVKESKVKCQGINECKGKGSCASAKNDCAGLNTCKAKGWLEVTAKECTDRKGTVLLEKKQNEKPKPATPKR